MWFYKLNKDNCSDKINEYVNSIDKQILLAQQYKAKNDKLVFRYRFIDNDNKTINKLFKDNNNYFETFESRFNVKPYFDLEIEREDITKEDCDNILKAFIALLKSTIKEEFNISLKTSDICILDSCRKGKLSYHIVITDKMYFNSNDDQRLFVQYFCTIVSTNELFKWSKVLKDNTTEHRLIVDASVYAKTQNFRCVNQSKFEGSNNLKLSTKHSISDTLVRLFDVADRECIDISSIKSKYQKALIKQTKTRTNKPKDKNTVTMENIDERNINTKGVTMYDKLKLTINELKELPEYQQYLYIIPSQNDRNVWLSIGMALKNCGTYDDYVNFSKLGGKYQEGECDNWNGFRSSGQVYNIRTLRKYAMQCSPDLYEQISLDYKPYNRITTDIIDEYDQREFNNHYVSNGYSYLDFLQNDVSIIESSCGTGKTHAVFMHFQELHKENNDVKLLSIVNRIALADQHKETANKLTLPLDHYKQNIGNNNLVICINSIALLKKIICSDEIENYVVYIDEVSTFLQSLTNNSTLDHHAKEIYILFSLLLSKCFKIVCTDALINDSIFMQLQELRTTNNDSKLFLKNTYSRFENVKAIQYDDESKFFKRVEEETTELLNNKTKGFLFMSDRKKVVNDLYANCYSLATNEKQRSKFVKITADEMYELKDIHNYFKGKFVFCSPSITTGVDVTFEHKQRVFQYITGTSILSDNLFQQTTRTRNIEEVLFYSKSTNHESCYSDLESCKKTLVDYIETAKNCLNLKIEKNEIKVLEDSYFELYCYNEYVRDIYRTNVTKHYIKLLTESKFNVVCATTKIIKMNKKEKEEFEVLSNNEKDQMYDEFIEQLIHNNVTTNKFDKLQERCTFLNLFEDENMFENKVSNKCIEDLNTYKSMILDNKELVEHLNIQKLLMSDETLNTKLDEKIVNEFDINLVTNSISKVKLIRELEKECNIKYLDVNFDNSQVNLKINPTLFKSISKTFRCEKKEPQTQEQLKVYYADLIRHLNKDIVTSKRVNDVKNKSQKVRVYGIDKDKMLYHTYLLKKKATKFQASKYHPDALTFF